MSPGKPITCPSSQGLSPSEAHAERRMCIKSEFPTTWPEFCADRSILPSVFWSYYWHKIVMDKTVGSTDGIDSYHKADEMVIDFDGNSAFMLLAKHA